MKKLALLVCIVVVISATSPISAQTAADLNSIYGKSKYYEVSNRILMSAKFAGDGQICFAALQPDRMAGKEALSNNQLFMHYSEVARVFDRLATEPIFVNPKNVKRAWPGEGSLVTTLETKNGTVKLYFAKGAKSEDDDAIVAATMTWKDRICKE